MNRSLSVVIITLNEEKNIGRCLDSVLSLADEVVILDSFSTDNTVNICKEKGITPIQHNWEGYAKTKNYANSLAKHSYILSLDADEALSPTLLNSLQTIKQKGFEGVYSFNRLNNYCGTWIKFAGWYPDTKTRVFPRDKATWRGDFVHETLFVGNLPNTKVEGDLLHYSYYTKEEHIAREKKYAKLAAERAAERGKSYSSLENYLSAFTKFLKMYLIKGGFLHGKTGFTLCAIAAKGKIWRATL